MQEKYNPKETSVDLSKERYVADHVKSIAYAIIDLGDSPRVLNLCKVLFKNHGIRLGDTKFEDVVNTARKFAKSLQKQGLTRLSKKDEKRHPKLSKSEYL